MEENRWCKLWIGAKTELVNVIERVLRSCTIIQSSLGLISTATPVSSCIKNGSHVMPSMGILVENFKTVEVIQYKNIS
jgi:hypothetical protein